MSTPPTATAPGALLARLREVLPPRAVVDDPDVIAAYSRDQAPFLTAGRPLAVVLPTCTEEVAAVVTWAAEHRCPVVTRGAGSGLAGGANALDGSVVICLSRMNRILDIDTANRLALVQPGVITQDLRHAVAAQHLFYPPDPGSVEFSTLGGNVATNAGGMCCVKYGVTGDFVLGLEVVLAGGTILRTGRRTVKSVAGYDLTHLFVGSEGTLGIITEITLALRPAPQPGATAVATFATLDAAGAAVEAITRAGQVPSMLEILDHTTLHAIDDMTRMGVSDGVAAMLIAQSDSSHAHADVTNLADLCRAAGALDVVDTDDPAEGDQLLQARRLALPALERSGGWLLDDVAVPRSRMVHLIETIQQISAATGLTIGVFGHAGDGNLHPTILYDRDDTAAVTLAQSAFDQIVQAALDLGGTTTGEHGVGLLKRDWLERELGPVGLTVHRDIKAALDPTGLLNPGKVFTDSTAAGNHWWTAGNGPTGTPGDDPCEPNRKRR